MGWRIFDQTIHASMLEVHASLLHHLIYNGLKAETKGSPWCHWREHGESSISAPEEVSKWCILSVAVCNLTLKEMV